jgi:voltage-gated potassium channel
VPSEPNPSRRLHVQALHWYRRYPVAVFLCALTLGLVAAPFEERLRYGEIVESVRLSVVLLVGLLALSDSRRTSVRGLVLVAPVVLGIWLHNLLPDAVPVWAYLVPGLLFLGYLVDHLLRFIVRAPRIDSEVLCAGVAGYLVLGLLWSLAYLLVANLIPGAFGFPAGPDEVHVLRGFNAVYFSFITLTTVGYGDIVPLASPARMLAMLEGICGTLYMAVLISRLVSLYASSRPNADAGECERQEPPSSGA